MATAFLCRDKPAMKEVLREAGIACAQSTRAETPQDARNFATAVGFPLIIKPPAGAGASGTYKVRDVKNLESVINECGLADGNAVAIEEFIEGHEGYIDTLTIGGDVTHEFITHYYPNVLEAIDPHLSLNQLHSFEQRRLMDDRAHLDVLVQPAFDLRVEVVDWPLADADHVRAGSVQRAHEFALTVRKRRLDKNDGHKPDKRRNSFTYSSP